MSEERSSVSCGVVVLGVLFINGLIGGLCSDFVLRNAFGVDIPWWGDFLVGLFGGEVTIPAACITFVLSLFIDTPLFG